MLDVPSWCRGGEKTPRDIPIVIVIFIVIGHLNMPKVTLKKKVVTNDVVKKGKCGMMYQLLYGT